MTEEKAHKWLIRKKKKKVKLGGRGNRPRSEARMICIGRAGADCNAFKAWDAEHLDIISVELPARNSRFKDKGMTDVHLIVRRIAQAINICGFLESEIPLVIFGHAQFGCLLSLHLTDILKKDYNFVPKQLVLAGSRPLHVSIV